MLVQLCLFTACDLNLDNDCLRGEGDKETRVVDLSTISSIETFGCAHIILTEGDEQSIKIESYPNLIDELLEDSSVDGETWKVGIDEWCISALRSDIKIHMTVPTIKSISLVGTGEVTNVGTFENIEDLDIMIDGTGDVDLDLGDDVGAITCDIQGTGTINLSGRALSQDFVVEGTSKIRSFDMITESCKIRANGTSNIKVHTEDILDVELSGTSSVCYRGNPELTTDLSGVSSVDDCN